MFLISELVYFAYTLIMESLPNLTLIDDFDLSDSSDSEEEYTLRLSETEAEPVSLTTSVEIQFDDHDGEVVRRLRQETSPMKIGSNHNRRMEATAAGRADFRMSDQVRQEKEQKIMVKRAMSSFMAATREAAMARKSLSVSSVSLK